MGVQFEEPGVAQRVRPEVRKGSFAGIFVSMGLVKTERGGEMILIVLALLALVAAGFLFMESASPIDPPQPLPGDEVSL